ncbi:hypothetical protein ACERZ8_15490 [Tateyamaria armeniaca]|uniref:Uncharacterized protein n=1 Tax=Tateyamaria armeniaca TaxID=2518930 RepID=A0ABW8UYX0_9RHOB
MQAEPVADVSDAQILEKISQHLLTLAEDTALVGKRVSELTGSVSTSLSPSAIRDLQKLDNLHQSLCDLAHLSAALAGPGAHRAQAFEHLKLTATRTLLEVNASERPVAHGTIDFF